MVRPILGLHYVLDQHKLEGVQLCATKLVSSLKDKSHITRLTISNLPSQLYRLRRGDLILNFLFKLLNGYF